MAHFHLLSIHVQDSATDGTPRSFCCKKAAVECTPSVGAISRISDFTLSFYRVILGVHFPLRPAYSPSHLATLYTGGFGDVVAFVPAPIATDLPAEQDSAPARAQRAGGQAGWSTPVGWDSHPLKIHAFSRRTELSRLAALFANHSSPCPLNGLSSRRGSGCEGGADIPVCPAHCPSAPMQTEERPATPLYSQYSWSRSPALVGFSAM